MRSEPDLYPPDAEVVTKDMETSRNRAIFGTALVTLGSGLMLERTLDNDLDFFWLAVGLGLIAGWLRVPRFPMFAVGSILTGFAAGGFIESLVSAPFESTIAFVSAAAGFFAVYARYPHRARWAVVPAAIFALLAVGSTGVELIGLIPAALGTMLLPVLLIAGGSLLLFRNSLPRRSVTIGLALLAVLFVGSAAATIDEWDPDPDFFEGRGLRHGERSETESLPDLDGRVLVVETTAGTIDVTTTSDDEGSVTAHGGPFGRPDIDFEEEDDEVRVSVDGSARRVTSWSLEVPSGSEVRAATTTGRVDVVVDGIDLDISSATGDVGVQIAGNDGSVDVTTQAGAVTVTSTSSVDLEAESVGGVIQVNGERCASPCERSDDGPDVTIATTTGPVTVAAP